MNLVKGHVSPFLLRVVGNRWVAAVGCVCFPFQPILAWGELRTGKGSDGAEFGGTTISYRNTLTSVNPNTASTAFAVKPKAKPNHASDDGDASSSSAQRCHNQGVFHFASASFPQPHRNASQHHHDLFGKHSTLQQHTE